MTVRVAAFAAALTLSVCSTWATAGAGVILSEAQFDTIAAELKRPAPLSQAGTRSKNPSGSKWRAIGTGQMCGIVKKGRPVHPTTVLRAGRTPALRRGEARFSNPIIAQTGFPSPYSSRELAGSGFSDTGFPQAAFFESAVANTSGTAQSIAPNLLPVLPVTSLTGGNPLTSPIPPGEPTPMLGAPLPTLVASNLTGSGGADLSEVLVTVIPSHGLPSIPLTTLGSTPLPGGGESFAFTGGDGGFPGGDGFPAGDGAATPVIPNPEPASAVLMVLGMIGVGGARLRKRLRSR